MSSVVIFGLHYPQDNDSVWPQRPRKGQRGGKMYLQVLWRVKGHQVRQELQQEDQRFLAVAVVTAGTSKGQLKINKQLLL